MGGVAVTGATGYIGRHLVARLVAAGERPRCLVRAGSNVSGLPHGKVEVVTGDVAQPAALATLMEGVESVVHCASVVANIKESKSLRYAAINEGGTRNVLRAAKEASVRHLMHLGGINTVPGAEGSYMRTRYNSERLVHEGGVPYSILQPSILFGEGAAFFVALADLVRRAPVIPVPGNGAMRFQPIWVGDVVTCLERLLAEGGKNETIPVGGPAYYSYDQLLALICRTLGKRRATVHVPMVLMRAATAAIQAVLARPPVTTATLELFSLGIDNLTALDAVIQRFSFAPRSLEVDMRENGI